MPNTADRGPEGIPWGDAAWLAAAAGLAAAAVELAVLGVRKYFRGLFVFLPVETVWMTPLATVVLFLMLTLGLWVLGRGLGRPVARRHVVGFLAGLVVMSALLLLPALHQGASIVVALGAGMAIGRARWPGHPVFGRWGRRLVLGLAPVVAAAGLGLAVVRATSERRAIERLPAPAVRTNVLLLVLDTVRAASLSAWGYERETSPELAAWSRRGTRFTNAESPSPWTLPSHASLFTGRWAHELPTNWYEPLDDRDPTVAEHLASAGYLTAGFVANVGYAGRETGLARGFQHYEDFPIGWRALVVAPVLVRTIVDHRLVRRLAGTKEKFVRKKAGDVNAAFLRWLDRRGDRPFFAFLNYYDAHTPFNPPEPFRSRFAPPGAPFDSDPTGQLAAGERWTPSRLDGARNAYDGAIASLDHHLGLLFEALSERGLLDSTLVVITSDHGEEFGEHGLFSHGNSLYRPALHVPLLMSLPGTVPAGDTIAEPVSIRDLAATIADLVAAPGPQPFPGRSLARFWQGAAAPLGERIFLEVRGAPNLPAWYPTAKGDLIGVQEDWLKVIRNADGSLEAYDLDRDPGERNSLVDDDSIRDRVEALRAAIERARDARLRAAGVAPSGGTGMALAPPTGGLGFLGLARAAPSSPTPGALAP